MKRYNAKNKSISHSLVGLVIYAVPKWFILFMVVYIFNHHNIDTSVWSLLVNTLCVVTAISVVLDMFIDLSNLTLEMSNSGIIKSNRFNSWLDKLYNSSENN